MEFEWDEEKNLSNILKHKVSFDEALEAFSDENRIILADSKHSDSEQRYFCIGRTSKDICTVRFTIRGSSIRIFGAGYWRREKRYYENKGRKSDLH